MRNKMAFTARSILCDVVADNAAEFPSQPAVVFPRSAGQGDAQVLSYGELAGRAWGMADWLQSRLAPGSRVMLALPTGPESVTAFVGCLAAGMVAVPAPIPDNYMNARRRTVGIIRDSGTALVLAAQADLPAIDALAREKELGITCSAVPDTPAAGAPPRIRGRGQARDTLAFLQYTSGSTGEPKGVMVTHGNIVTNTDLFRRRLGMDSSTRFGGWIPLFHDMGLISLLCLPLLLGSTTVLTPPSAFLRRPLDWLRIIDQYGINMSAAPNFAYDMCTRTVTDEQAAALDLSRWRYAFNGSEPVHAPTLAAFARKFAVAGFRADALLPAYGMAEATLFISSRLPSEPAKALAVDPGQGNGTLTRHVSGPAVVSCGAPEGFDVRIVDPATREVLPDASIGEIWLRGPSVTNGYWQQAAATAAAFSGVTAAGEAKWLRTGDLGALRDGELYITGRRKEMLVIRGRNLFPQDLEHEARTVHPALAGMVGAAFGVAVPDERVVIVHEVNVHAAGGELPRIATAIKARLTEAFAVPARNVVLVRRGSVCRTTSGKIERVATRRLFLDDSLRVVHASVEPAVARLIGAQELTGAAPAVSGAA
jgi:acyl-CoA synthetase (AMP-forming)/AMP-acid ligase II